MTPLRIARAASAVVVCAVGLAFSARVPAESQAAQHVVPCPATQQALLEMPEIASNGAHKLKGTVRVSDGIRTLWGPAGDSRCATQFIRYYSGTDPARPIKWPAGPDPLPGPTLRANVGDLVELTFFNEVNVNDFGFALDRGDVGTMGACDQYTVGSQQQGSAGQDTMPDCLHGSSTANIHYHGTHTTPSTSGDNVLIFVRPALRTKTGLTPSETNADSILAAFFQRCETNGPPKLWTDMPLAWQNLQKSLLQQYDNTVPYQGHPGTLPASMRLWPADQAQIAAHLWPQYQLGAAPYCFPLPKYDPAKMRMGQSPGTHWYHAHKHGSTALNVANGMVGAFIIQGQYDTDLHHHYASGLRERVLIIEQLASAPFPLINPTGGPGSGKRPRLWVNGRIDPLVGMRPGEVQMWRIVNGAWRDGVQFAYFKPTQPGNAQCNAANAPAPAPSVQWRQIAQDGVQLNVANYSTFGAVGKQFNLAPANRADLLVKAPSSPGNYTLCIVANNGLLLQTAAPAAPSGAFPEAPSALLTVAVGGTAVSPAMDFIPNANFPAFPSFLNDITSAEVHGRRRELVFGPGSNTIDGKKFDDHHVDQTMTLNTAEEWIVMNQANDKQHPFHIHINPFQILELFQPNAASQPCPIDPNNPNTFDPNLPGFVPCNARVLPPPWVWWDTFAIPTGKQGVPVSCTAPANCPQLQPYALACTNGACTITVPGWFRMRSRFVDFTGQYVIHCHILIHEDRGMMQLVEVVPGTSPYSHH